MKGDWIRIFAFVLVSSLGIISCSSSTNMAEGGIGGTGISMGVATELGSITVNGVYFETTGAEIYKDGVRVGIDSSPSQIETMLNRGMVVTVKGAINSDGVTGTATSVNYADNLEGPITAIPNPNLSLIHI